MVSNKCKYLTPITKKRTEVNPHLQGRHFCLKKCTTTIGDFEKNYDLILCEYEPKLIQNCPIKKNNPSY